MGTGRTSMVETVGDLQSRDGFQACDDFQSRDDIQSRDGFQADVRTDRRHRGFPPQGGDANWSSHRTPGEDGSGDDSSSERATASWYRSVARRSISEWVRTHF